MSKLVSHSLLTDFDISLFKAGKHFRMYRKLGCHLMDLDHVPGAYFAVWAPNARNVSVIGSFNGWNPEAHALAPRWDQSGIWEGFIPGVQQGHLYKYHILAADGRRLEKTDPYGRFFEIPPNTATVVWDTQYTWQDDKWLEHRRKKAGLEQPFSVYEVHLGSWMKKDGGAASLSYRELAQILPVYVSEMGFTHVEFLPVMEHPYFPSWGYQLTGYFAPSSRFGTPEDFMHLVDKLHQTDVGVILDWVPSHFPNDAHGLADFDGTHLYDHADPRKGFHPDWKSAIFNYDRYEVRSFLISNALYWLDQFHADGLRVDAVASMLYLDYSRKEGEWVPNHLGGKENLEAISFLKEFNETVYTEYPDTINIAEESTAWSGVSKPTYEGGLGFGQKWMMGWMHDTLKYFMTDPLYRSHHHNTITFSIVYAFSEHFMLPLSHDEVVHGKGPLIDRMPGDQWQRFANLRLLFGYMWMHPGSKLLFMGGEFGQTTEWSIEKGIQWQLLDYAPHQGVQQWIRTLNQLYTQSPTLYSRQFSADGFEWIDLSDYRNSVLVFLRKGREEDPPFLTVLNFTPVVRKDYNIGVPEAEAWEEILNSDDAAFGGTGEFNNNIVQSQEVPLHGRSASISLTLPPLAVIVLKPVANTKRKTVVKKAAS
jgi:1,4-alpha-glucan branching enzyme